MQIDRRTMGSGLGLTIAKQIVKAHCGKMGVESEVGFGSRFWFAVPLGYEKDVYL